MDRKRQLLIQKIDQQLAALGALNSITAPSQGWIKSLRTTLNMTLDQLGKRLGVSRSAVKRMETREQSGSMSINGLQQVAQALGMKLIYALVPEEKTLKQYIHARARKVAEEIVVRTGTTMDLEGQTTDQKRRDQEIENLTQQLVEEMPKYLWN